MTLNFLSIFILISFSITLIVQKIFSKKNGILLDSDFSKPQAFHKNAIARSGGLSSIILFSIFIAMYFFFFKKFLLDYLTIGISIFCIGFLDDIKIMIKPKIRLLMMTSLLSAGIILFSVNLGNIDLIFLELMLNNKIFNVLFILLCFLFIVNGANLVDGFNGLVSIHLIIINTVLFFINFENGHTELMLVIFAQIIMLISFLMFNFPKAKMFLGDGGSYLFGVLLALNIIKTNNLNAEISSFFFCILLFYLFFEVFFSFFRKIYLSKSPLKPDNNHLHMLSYRWLNKPQKFKDCNYLNSLMINLIYLVLISPSIYFRNNGLFCKYWFFSLLAIYIITYLRLYSFTKK